MPRLPNTFPVRRSKPTETLSLYYRNEHHRVKIVCKIHQVIILLFLNITAVNAFTVALTGDIMMGTTTPEPHLPPQDGALLFRYVSPTLLSADFVFGNLEGTLCDSDPTPRQCRDSSIYYIFKTPQHYAQNLADAGFHAVSIANNHINDFGWEGRDSTIVSLRRAGIVYTGLRGGSEIRIIERNGKRIGICAFSHNSVTADVRNIPHAVKLISSLRERCDYVIVSFHGGAEGKDCLHVTREMEYYVGERRGNVYEFAHACIDAGADVVFGHGPHVPRALELYNDRLIAYSLGNFCTPYGVSINGINGYAPLLLAEIDDRGRFIRGRIDSYIQKKGAGPQPDPLNLAAYLIMRLTAQDFPETNLIFVGNVFMRKDL